MMFSSQITQLNLTRRFSFHKKKNRQYKKETTVLTTFSRRVHTYMLCHPKVCQLYTAIWVDKYIGPFDIPAYM